MIGSEEGGRGSQEVVLIEASGSVGDRFTEELLCEEEIEVVISDEGLVGVCGIFIEELLGVEEEGAVVNSGESLCSSGGRGFNEELSGVEDGGGGWSIEGGPLGDLPVE